MKPAQPTVLLIARGLVHPTWLACRILKRALEATPGLRFRSAASLEILPRIDMETIQSAAIYFHHKHLSPAALERLDGFLRQGGGLLAVHGAAASFKTEPRYHAILGGRFVGHGAVAHFEVQPVPGEEGIFAGIGSFTVRDELYRHEYDPSSQVHFTTPVGTGQEPVVWTRRHGEGRICYCSLGHTAGVLRHTSVIELLQRGLRWVSGLDPQGKEAL
jgi:type 1 glutamine amidotransferase